MQFCQYLLNHNKAEADTSLDYIIMTQCIMAGALL